MPRKKSHGYPPSKRIKNNTEKVLSMPIKAKPLENCERSSNEVLIESSLLKSESAQENLPVHGKYLHKKFKKMATTALSPDETLNGNRVKSVLFPVPNKNNEDEVSSQKITPTELVLPITSNKNEMTENNRIINTASSMNVIFPIGSNALGRHICSYCKLVCAKPSVLQKHIRAHTNERPYPCQPCGFAFKTKSNLYKHCRSRAHALKVEEVGDEMSSKFNLPLEESTSEDEDIPTKVSEINSNEEITNNNKEEPPTKSIYKPKFHTASIYLQSSVNVEKEDTSDTELQSQRVLLKIPTSLSSQSILSTPSPFTSGSSPSPEFLHRHISKLISENQAIVETMDPFWPKKFLHRTNSKDNSSPSSLSSSPSPGAENLIPKRNVQRLSNSTIDNLSNIQENVSDSERNVGLRHTTHSKLALALLRPQSSTSPLFSSSSAPSESIDAPLNLTTNSSKLETFNTNNRKRSYSEGLPSPKCLTNKISNIQLKLYNMKQESGKPINSFNDTPVSLFANNVDEKKCSQPGNPQNPEGSIIKDLLLKARAASTGPLLIGNYATSMPEILSNIKASNIIVHEKDERSFSPNQFVCDVCKITFRNVQSFDFHQLYYCKGLREESSSLNSPPPHFGSVSDLPSNKILLNNKDRKDFGKRDPILIAPSYPSPGPLLGNTPLVDSYYTNHQEFEGSSKKRKVENENLLAPKNVHPVSATTLRSLEELSKYPMRSNALQMFGGEVKILDTAGGETKTIRIEPSNRGTPQTTEVQLLLSTHSPDKKNLNIDQIEGKESNPQIVVTIAKTGLHSGGGTIVQVPQKITVNDSIQQQISKQNSTSTTVNTTLTPTVEPHTIPNSSYGDSNKYIIPIIPNIISQNLSLPAIPTPVQLPFIPFTSMMTDNNIINPLTSITAYNPLTLPTASFLSSIGKRPNSDMSSPYSGGLVTILHGGKEIPYVPGMPGPHSLLSTNSNLSFSGKTSEEKIKEEKSQDKTFSIHQNEHLNLRSDKISLTSVETTKSNPLSFFILKQNQAISSIQLDNGSEVLTDQVVTKRKINDDNSVKLHSPLKKNILSLKSSESAVTSEELNILKAEQSVNSEKRFLRPSSLPLKPGTFIPKRHTLSTPTNVLSLVSPETPRPRKSYGQLYLNGHAYTYLGLKCSTRVFFCTLNKPQPIYVPLSPEHNKVSMYSNWKVCSEADPNPFGLDPGKAMAFYDSRHRPLEYSLASIKTSGTVTHSTYWNNQTCNKKDRFKSDPTCKNEDNDKSEFSGTENMPKRVKIFAGGFESNEEYIYVRGRGRGRYVCEECGIRCKKPSMLKKHIRTHTDVRPFTCTYCRFSFKTKGNLTKHMKSKAHYKKCVELAITPVPTVVDDSNVDEEALARQQTLQGIETEETEDEDEDDDDEEDEEDDEDDEDDSDEWKNFQEREAARSLLVLSETLQSEALLQERQYIIAGLVAKSARPNTYPYNLTMNSNQVLQPQTPTLTSISAQREREKVSQITGLAREVHKDGKLGDLNGKSMDKSKGNESELVASHYYFPSSSITEDGNSNGSDESNQMGSQEGLMDCNEKPNDISNSVKLTTVGPMDLSNKNPESEVKSRVRVCEAAMLLASLCSTMERLPVTSTPTVPEDSALLQAYLTERAMRDSRMKQQQYKVNTTKTDADCHLNTFEHVLPKKQFENYTKKQTDGFKSISGSVQEAQDSTSENDATSMFVTEIETFSPKSNMTAAKENALDILARTSSDARKIVSTPASPGTSSGSAVQKPKAEFMPPSNGPSPSYVSQLEDGRSMCIVCNKVFTKPSQLRLHVNIHYFERPFRCESCAVSFRTKGHLQKHQRSVSHLNKVSMNSTFGAPTTSNPRPFKCDDCKIAFRIHGHLAKHLRSKMHIMKLECLGKLPFGTYAEMERSGINMNDIDTTDCENSLESLQMLAHKLYEKDPSKLGQWDPNEMMPPSLSSGDTTSEDEEQGITCPSPPITSRDQLTHKSITVSPIHRLPVPNFPKPSVQRLEPLKYVSMNNSPVESNYKSSKHKSTVPNMIFINSANELESHAQVSKSEMLRSSHDKSKTVSLSESDGNHAVGISLLTDNSELSNSDTVMRISNNLECSRTDSLDNQDEKSDIKKQNVDCYATRGND